MNLLLRNGALIAFILVTLFFFRGIVLRGELPMPADTIIGLYHPYRDLYATEYPNGIPFKNFLITDPVRQQYPWRMLVTESISQLQLPLWNPYAFSGTPLLGNFQNGTFYPLTLLFLVLPSAIAWTLLIMSAPLLAGTFLFMLLRHYGCSSAASFLGALTFAFCGFSVAWMEWGTVVHVGLWLPLLLLAIDKIMVSSQSNSISHFTFPISNKQIKMQKKILWSVIFTFALCSSFFAGHLQTFFYLSLVTAVYLLARWWQNGRQVKSLLLFIICYLLFVILSFVQWYPTFQFILLSARSLDQGVWQQPEWFIPWQHLIQFIAPDFFGNPSTLNYWGVWNYGEFIGYIGIFPLLLALYALFFRRDKKTLFFGTLFFLSLIFALPTFFAKIPFLLQIPFIATAQPTRLLFVTDFTLCILAAFGLDYFLIKKRGMVYTIGFLALMIIVLWGVILFIPTIDAELLKNTATAKRNLFLPTMLFLVCSGLMIGMLFTSKKYQKISLLLLLGITVFDVVRFADKFISFSRSEYLFPPTKILHYLQDQPGQFRIMSTDSSILPPNFASIYHLQTVEGYDPLYLERYAQLLIANEREKPDIAPPFGFNRILTPHNYNSKIIDLLGVKYILSLSDIKSDKFSLIMSEGQTKLFLNKDALPRAFFVSEIRRVADKQQAIQEMFTADFAAGKLAIVESHDTLPSIACTTCRVAIHEYADNTVTLQTEGDARGFLVLTDTYYPTWRASIDGKPTPIYRTDFNFRGVMIPSGKHTVVFTTSLL